MLELYQAEGCPHSTEVRETLSELGISYVVHNPRAPGEDGGDVRNEQTQREMIAIGGRDQIPFLVDTKERSVTYGSDDIIAHLEAHYR